MIIKVFQQKQYGIGLLEIMLALVIIAILLIMATRYYLVASDHRKVNDMISIVSGYKAAFACSNKKNQAKMNPQNMSDQGCLATQLWDPTTDRPVGPWGDGSWKWTTTGGSPYAELTYSNLSQKACKALENKYSNDSDATFDCSQPDNKNTFVYRFN